MTFEDDRPEDRQEGAPEGETPQDRAPEEPPQQDSEPEGGQADAAPEESAPEELAAQDVPGGLAPQEEEASAEAAPEGPSEATPGPEQRPPRGRKEAEGEQPDVVPGADLEPDLVLDEPARAGQDEYGDAAYAERYAEPEGEPGEPSSARPEEAPARAEAPAARTPMELAADARYQATGKRKTSVARVILKPGNGTYTVNGRTLEQFFPRFGLQATARQPLSAAGYETRMDVVARLHGGGVSAQAGALRHGVARALVEADPSLREDLKRRGYLTRDPRAKERKKAGLKKARKRPQFSKR
jgi:small subunit ribosomal protein S9